MTEGQGKKMFRRDFLKVASVAVGGSILAACAPAFKEGEYELGSGEAITLYYAR